MDRIRYGVFLRPDAATCWTVQQITLAIERQFGLVSAGAFPPHVTLLGNLATAAAEEDLQQALNPVFAGVRSFTVHNAGLVRSMGYFYDVDHDASGIVANGPLHQIAARVHAALLPLSTPVRDHLVTPVAEYRFSGHVGLTSHELHLDDSLETQIGEFIDGLPVAPPPPTFAARWFSLFRFESDWSGRWWETLSWRHVRSWEVR